MKSYLKKTKLVGDFIKNRREALNLSQKDLGLLFQPAVTTQFVSNLERGVTPLPPVHVPALAKALSVSDKELMTLLEKEYVLKLAGRLGKMNPDESPSETKLMPSIRVSPSDLDWMQSFYYAYQVSDLKTRSALMTLCESLLKFSNSSFNVESI